MGCGAVASYEPSVEIRVQRHGSTAFRAAVAETQGVRPTHEDAHEISCRGAHAGFWVLDGHGGDSAARFGVQLLTKELPPAPGSLPSDEIVEQGFAKADQALRELFEQMPAKACGATALGALAAKCPSTGNYSLKVFNCGDSRAVVVRAPGEEEADAAEVTVRRPSRSTSPSEGPAWPIIVESRDHKPSSPRERARIEQAGGRVWGEDPPRIDGVLAVSRGIGDFEYKADTDRKYSEQKVSCAPDIYEATGLLPGSIIVLACDGLWDVLSSQYVASFVRDRLKSRPAEDLGALAAELVRLSQKYQSLDNVSVLVAQCSDGSPWASKKEEMQVVAV